MNVWKFSSEALHCMQWLRELLSYFAIYPQVLALAVKLQSASAFTLHSIMLSTKFFFHICLIVSNVLLGTFELYFYASFPLDPALAVKLEGCKSLSMHSPCTL